MSQQLASFAIAPALGRNPEAAPINTLPPVDATAYATLLTEAGLDDEATNLAARLHTALADIPEGLDPTTVARVVIESHYRLMQWKVDRAVWAYNAKTRTTDQRAEDAAWEAEALAAIDLQNAAAREARRKSTLGKYANATLDSPLPVYMAETADLRAWAQSPGNWDCVVLWGPSGSGKTHAACATFTEYLKTRPRASFAMVGWQELRAAFADNDSKESTRKTMEKVRHASVLIIDDLGTDKWTEHQVSELIAVLNQRRAENKHTIVTMNLAYGDDVPRGTNPFTEDRSPIWEANRLWSRLSACDTYRWDAADQRPAQGRHR